MKKTLILDGGLGRHISSIGALENFVDRNEDCTIITQQWTPIFWGNPILTPNVFDIGTKGLFDRIKNSSISKPEPYFNSDFINEKISMSSAFNIEINGKDCLDKKPSLYLTKTEIENAFSVVDKARKTIVFQPFGSAARVQNNLILDDTCRSMSKQMVTKILNVLKKNNFQVILLDSKNAPFINHNEIKNLDDRDFRSVAAVIKVSDYFIGCDSSGQHMAYALDKPGSTWFGGSSSINFGYHNYFKIFEKSEKRRYMPFRISEFDYWLAGTQNDIMLEYTDEEISDMCEKIIKDIRDKT